GRSRAQTRTRSRHERRRRSGRSPSVPHGGTTLRFGCEEPPGAAVRRRIPGPEPRKRQPQTGVRKERRSRRQGASWTEKYSETAGEPIALFARRGSPLRKNLRYFPIFADNPAKQNRRDWGAPSRGRSKVCVRSGRRGCRISRTKKSFPLPSIRNSRPTIRDTILNIQDQLSAQGNDRNVDIIASLT